MKISPSAVLILSAGMILRLPAAGQMPNGPVFTITMEQKGSVEDKSFTKVVEAGYWPCAAWNSGHTGGVTYSEMSVMGAQMNASPEGLLAARGSIAAMKPGETMIFYVREKSGSGNDGVSSVTLTTAGDGVFSYTVVTENDTWTSPAGGPVTEPGRRAFGPAGNTEAVVKRTVDGAILTISEPDLEGEGDCDFFSILSSDNEPEGMPEALTFKLSNEDLKNWQAFQKVNNRVLSGFVDGTLEISATLRGGPISYAEAEVTIEGCSEMGIGESGQLTASGKPEGGSYRFWTEPSDVLTVQADGASATLKGASPGRTAIFVEYTSPEGATVQNTKNGACVKVESYNGGQPIPQVAFYDFDGKRLKGINVPVSIQPSDAADLLKYVPADPGILTVIGLGNEVVIQGIRQGKTTFQAKTLCGGTTGPVIDVEVVNCDDETIAKLNEQARIANESLKELAQEMERLVNSDEYKRAHGRILESTADLALKTSTLIIGTLGGLPGADKAVTTASKISGIGSSLLDLLRSGNSGEQQVNMLKMTVELFGDNVVQGVFGTTEALEAAKNFGDDLMGVENAAQKTADIYNSLDQLKRFIDNLSYRMRLCASDPEQTASQEESAGEPSQTPNDPTPKTDKPPAKEPTVDKPTPEEPTDEEPTDLEPGDDGTEISPPPPTSEPTQVSLPYMSSDECGCNNSKEIGLSQEGFSSLQAGMKNLGECVNNFSEGPLNDYAKTLGEWQSVTDSLTNFIKSGAAGLEVAAKETIPHIESLLQRTQSFDEAGKAFVGEFKNCSESMNSIMEVLRTAEIVTVDSITTKY